MCGAFMAWCSAKVQEQFYLLLYKGVNYYTK